MDNKIKTNPAMVLAAILLCLVLISTYFTTGLYARYTVKAPAEDGARVASFKIYSDLDVSVGSGATPVLYLGGEEQNPQTQLPFYIASDSEVTVGYTVTVDFKTSLPDYLDLTLSDGTTTARPVVNGSKYVFEDFGTMPAATSATQQTNLVLTITVADLTMIAEEISIPAAELTVKVYQLD